MKDYKNSKITLEGGVLKTDFSEVEVMMDWEDDIMRMHADEVCKNGGDILEVGFGLGISAGYIQEHNPRTHTIVEVHPQILERLYKWAEDKDNVIIVEGDWYDVQDQLGMYDGILYDAIHDPNMGKFYNNFVPKHIKENGVFSFFNGLTYEIQYEGLPEVSYIKIGVEPTKNRYFNEKEYLLPVVRF